MEGEWRKIYVKSLNSPVWKDADKWRFWSWCLLKATRTPTTEFVRKTAVDLLPGQLLYGRRMAQKETGLSEQTVVSCAKALSGGKDPSIKLQPYHNYTILTIVKWRHYQNGDATSIPQLRHNYTTSQPQAIHNSAENGESTSPLSPRARAPARNAVRELRASHTADACGDFDLANSEIYHSVLETIRQATGRRGVDANGKEGAMIFAHAIMDGGITLEELSATLKAGLNDPKLPNQGVRGVAKNYTLYLPKTADKPKTRSVEFVCEKCGVRVCYQWGEIEPTPIPCTADGCNGRMHPGWIAG